MPLLNSRLEVADFLDVSQFIKMLSAYMCVAFSGALVKHAGEPGHGPSGTVQQAIADATAWYTKLEGSDTASNTNGMSLEAEYLMLKGMGLVYHAVNADVVSVKAALEQGYPLLICGAETGMHDLDLGDRVPYAWTPTGNHCIVASGIASDGNLLVHDCANVDQNGVIRPGPRRYDAAKLQLVSATAVAMPWLSADGGLALPANWTDDGHTLSCPDGKAVLGFRQEILNLLQAGKWDADDYIQGEQYYTARLEDSNPALGGGDQLLTRKHLLGYPHDPQGNLAHLKNQVIVEYLGTELGYYRKQAYALLQENKQLRATPAMPQDHAALLQIAEEAAKAVGKQLI